LVYCADARVEGDSVSGPVGDWEEWVEEYFGEEDSGDWESSFVAVDATAEVSCYWVLGVQFLNL
jgi:hypothetical protein